MDQGVLEALKRRFRKAFLQKLLLENHEGRSVRRLRLFITKHGSVLHIGMAKVLPIIDILGYDGQKSSFSSSSPPYSDSTPITQKGNHISA